MGDDADDEGVSLVMMRLVMMRMLKGKPDKEVVCLDSAVGDEDDADDEDDEGVSLVMMRAAGDGEDDEGETRQGGRLCGFGCG